MEEKDKKKFDEHKECKCEKSNCSDKHEENCKCQSEQKECKCHEDGKHSECHHEDKKDKFKKEKHKHKEEIEKLNKIIEDKDKKLLEAKAELINYGKRKDLEVSTMLKYASEDLVKELLQVVDNFERAIKLDDENLDDELSKFLSGFKMIYCNLVKILESNGVKAIDGANKPFDPTYHEAVLTEAREGVEEGNVLEVLQKGYLYKGKVIRPAMVKVSE